MAEHIYTYDNPPSAKDLARACRVLGNDGVIGAPAAVNWNFLCAADRPKALSKVHGLKPARPKEQPLSLVCSSISMASEYGYIDQSGYRMLKKIWPGPYTVIAASTKSVLRDIKDKRKQVGIIVPASPLLRALVDEYGKPLAKTTIPEKAGGAAVQYGHEVFDLYGHAVDLILDLGEAVSGAESTLLDITGDSVVLRRQGAGAVEHLDFLEKP